MSAKLIWMVPAFVGAILLAGCKASDDYAQSAPPKAVVFAGKVDPKFVGAWKATNGISSMELSKDGSLKIVSVSESRNGKNVNKVSGEWTANGANLLFRYPASGQGSVVLKYSAKLDGKTLTMQQSGMKLKMVYKRQ